MENNFTSFIQCNSPDGGFLQSEEWRKFQKSVGRKAHSISGDNFYASIIEHILPIVGGYFYIPRGPVVTEHGTQNMEQGLKELIKLAKKENAGWIRIEPSNSRILDLIGSNWRVAKAPHDMQPKELFIIDIANPEEELLAEMKAKTRYNIRLAEKRGVIVREISNKKYIEEFLRLIKVTAERDKITPHPESYYEKMTETIPSDILKLYVAEYQGKIIAANLVVFYGNVCTYLHGASDNEYRNVMAPYLLQWQQIKDAKAVGCKKYDFGGVSTNYLPTGQAGESKMHARITNDWSGITRFKLGFSLKTMPARFPGCYDIIISRRRYWIYRLIQRIKK